MSIKNCVFFYTLLRYRPASMPQFAECSNLSNQSLVSPPRIQPLLHSPTRLRSPPVVPQPVVEKAPAPKPATLRRKDVSPKGPVEYDQRESYDPDLQRAIELSRQSISGLSFSIVIFLKELIQRRVYF